MSFFIIFIGKKSGLVRHVIQQETPFDGADLARIRDGSEELESREIGFVPGHDWRTLAGESSNPSRHVYDRIGELTPEQASDVLRAHPEMPEFLDCPCTVEGISSRLRARGPSGIHEKSAHWLEFMGVLSGDEMKAHGLPRLTISRAAEFDAARRARDPSAGSRLDVFKRQLRERAALRAARRRGE